MPSRTDTAGHSRTFDYLVTQRRSGIPRPLITQSHRHNWTYQSLWLPSHGPLGGKSTCSKVKMVEKREDRENANCNPPPHPTPEFKFEWGFYAQSASEPIFRARTYNRTISHPHNYWRLSHELSTGLIKRSTCMAFPFKGNMHMISPDRIRFDRLTWSQFTYSMALDAYHIDSVNTCYD